MINEKLQLEASPKIIAYFNNALFSAYHYVIKGDLEVNQWLKKHLKEIREIYKADRVLWQGWKEEQLIVACINSMLSGKCVCAERIGDWCYSFSPFETEGNEVGFYDNADERYAFYAGCKGKEKAPDGSTIPQKRRTYNR